MPKSFLRSFAQLLLFSLLLQQCGLSAAFAEKPILIAMTEEVRGMCQQAEQLINTGRFSDAMQILNRANGIDPNCAEVHGYLGMAYQNSMKTQQAIDEYQKALNLNPQMSFININLGTCYMNMNRPDEAAPYLQRYLQENPNAPDAAQARSFLQQAGARQGQQNLRGVVEQGQSLLNQHKYPEACRAFEQAIAQQPNFAPAHFYLGYALAQSGQHQRAISEFQSALQIDPSQKEAVMNIASNYQSLGDCPNAIAWYERYLSQNPGSPKSSEIKQRINGLKQQMGQNGGASAQHSASAATGFPSQQGFNAMPTSMQPGTSGGMPGLPNQQSIDDYFSNISSAGKYFRWARMPVRVAIAPGAAAAGYRDSFHQDLMDAFSIWAKGSENRLAFTLVQDPSQADIVCEWTGDPNKIVESGRSVEGGLTKISGQPQSNGDVFITKAKVLILTNRSGAQMSDDDMKKVCIHEVGHALGINGHSNSNTDIMFFSESPSIWPALTKRDKATICHLYAMYPKLVGN